MRVAHRNSKMQLCGCENILYVEQCRQKNNFRILNLYSVNSEEEVKTWTSACITYNPILWLEITGHFWFCGRIPESHIFAWISSFHHQIFTQQRNPPWARDYCLREFCLLDGRNLRSMRNVTTIRNRWQNSVHPHNFPTICQKTSK